MSSPGLTFSRAAAWVAGTVVFLWLVASLWRASYPPLPARITVDITFAPGATGSCEPIITTGAEGDGDFLALRHIDADTAVIFYDVWGVGGPASAPFALRPGERRTLEIELPTLAHVANFKSHEKRPLHLALDGRILLHEAVYFHRRKPAEIFFARNPIGGDLVLEKFRGQLALPQGRALAGGPEQWFNGSERLAWVASHRLNALAGRLVAAALSGLAAGWLLPWIARLRLPRPTSAQRAPLFPEQSRAVHGWFLGTAAICTLVFTTVLTGGTFRLVHQESFGEFYDFQAQSFLAGRLDLPDAARSSESFIFEGRHYMYFGPTPALLRLPFVYFNVAFAKLSRCAMLAYYVSLLIAVYALLLHVARHAGGPQRRPGGVAVVIFTALTGLGTTLFFVASRAYVYHEAILCGAMFALWSGYCSLRYLAEPEKRGWIGAAICGLLSVQARPTSGLFALCLLGAAAIAIAIRNLQARSPSSRGAGSFWRAIKRPFVAALFATAAILSFSGLSYLKFHSFEGAPLKYHVQYDRNRLAAIRGRNFHLENFRHNFDVYVWRPDFTWRREFPYFFIQRGPALLHDKFARMDLVEPTLPIPYAMPALLLLALGGGAWALFRWPASRPPLGVIAAASVPLTLALFTAVAVSQRYTADFCPALLLAGAFGLQATELLPVGARRWVTATLILLTILGILVTLAITLHYQGEVVWGVSDDVHRRYQSLRNAFDTFLGFHRP